MARRATYVAVAVAVAIVGWYGGKNLRSALSSRLQPIPSDRALSDPSTSGSDEAEGVELQEVLISLQSSDVPGCFVAGERFSVAVISFWRAKQAWRDKQAQNELVFWWEDAELSRDEIVVHVEGHRLTPTVSPGEVLPTIELTLPLETFTTTAKLTTFVFQARDAEDRACFTWESPPGTPQPYQVPHRSKETMAPRPPHSGARYPGQSG